MGTYQITISGDSPDSLRENVQAWLDSREDGSGTRCEAVQDESYQKEDNTAERANAGADTVYEATVWMQSGERLSQISTSTHPTFESAERRMMVYYDHMSTKIFAKKRTWEYDTDLPHAWSRKEENGLVLTIEQKEVRP